MSTKWTDVVSALAAVTVPIIILIATNKLEEQQNNTEVETRTLAQMNELDRKIDEILDRKIKLDKENNVDHPEYFSAKYLKLHLFIAFHYKLCYIFITLTTKYLNKSIN